eukprot:6189055-Pleurochrysis_carterae.AAC.1
MWAGIRLVLGLTAALHAIDDISYIWKWARLGAALLPFSYGENPDGLCELCDFVIAGAWMCFTLYACSCHLLPGMDL